MREPRRYGRCSVADATTGGWTHRLARPSIVRLSGLGRCAWDGYGSRCVAGKLLGPNCRRRRVADGRRLPRRAASAGPACCAVEAAGGVAAWPLRVLRRRWRTRPPNDNDLPTLHVLLVAGTVTRALAPEGEHGLGQPAGPGKWRSPSVRARSREGPIGSPRRGPGTCRHRGRAGLRARVPTCARGFGGRVQRAVREFAAGTAQQPRADIDGWTGKPDRGRSPRERGSR